MISWINTYLENICDGVDIILNFQFRLGRNLSGLILLLAKIHSVQIKKQ